MSQTGHGTFQSRFDSERISRLSLSVCQCVFESVYLTVCPSVRQRSKPQAKRDKDYLNLIINGKKREEQHTKQTAGRIKRERTKT